VRTYGAFDENSILVKFLTAKALKRFATHDLIEDEAATGASPTDFAAGTAGAASTPEGVVVMW
jgi:hypothetical protein